LIQQGEMAQLPDTTGLTENAVRAEEMLETLKADADLVGQLETGMEEALSSDEEQAILREFEESDEPAPAATEDAERAETPPARPQAVTPPTAEPGVAEPDAAEPPSSAADPKKSRPADAEPM
ncbi:MAG: hypothetical protein ACYSVY_23960, partial [Planctomycetota bacterium]